MAAVEYQHRSLSTGKEARLLMVHPGKDDAQIQLDLVHTPFADLANSYYEAISYTWGSEIMLHTIIIEQNPFYVTENVHKILTLLRRPDKPRVLWIDQICINQKNVVEKGHQVRRMRDIYQLANEVLVWLGESDDDTAETFSFLRSLHHNRRTNPNFLLAPFLNDGRNIGECIKESIIQLQRLGKLLSRAWFSRIWVWQEVAVASNVRVLCGQQSISWDAISEVVEMVVTYEMDDPVYQPLEGPSKSLNCARDILKLCQIRKKLAAGHHLYLQELMTTCTTCAAKDARDRIFSFLGIATDATDPQLYPDYQKSVSEVFHRAAAHLLCRDRYPWLLHISGHAKSAQCADLPSWVPDFSAIQKANILAPPPGTSGTYQANGSTHACIQIGKTEGKLVIRGLLFDRITTTSSACPVAAPSLDNKTLNNTASSAWTTMTALFTWYREVVTIVHCQTRRPYGCGQSEIHEAMMRTVNADSSDDRAILQAMYETFSSSPVKVLHSQFQLGVLSYQALNLTDVETAHPCQSGQWSARFLKDDSQ